MEITFLRNEDDVANSQREQRSSSAEMRFPDTALQQILGCLEFSDIRSCRLVSKQWHRFALDRISFVLRLQHVKTKQSPRTADSAAGANRTSPERYHVTLVPYPASLDWKAGEAIALRKVYELPASKNICLNQLADVVTNSFEQKIKHVIVKNAKAAIVSILPALATTTPAATTIRAINVGCQTTRFIRETRAGDFKCIELDIDSIDANYDYAGLQFFSSNGRHIRKLHASAWWVVKEAIEDSERDNDANELVLGSCEELLIKGSPSLVPYGSTAGPFREIVAHFPAIRKLRVAVGRYDRVDDIENLEQLTNLTSLTICNDSDQRHVLKKLCHPNLGELCLGNRIQLPQDQSDVFLPAVTILELEADFENALRLSTIGVPILSNLTALTMVKMPTGHVKPFLRSALPVTPKLQSLTIDLIPTNHLGRPVLIDIYDTLLVVPACTAAVTVGTVQIFPEAVYCSQLLKQRMEEINDRNLNTVITLQFKDNANNALVNTLKTFGIDSQAQPPLTCVLTWTNPVPGTVKKLRIQVLA